MYPRGGELTHKVHVSPPDSQRFLYILPLTSEGSSQSALLLSEFLPRHIAAFSCPKTFEGAEDEKFEPNKRHPEALYRLLKQHCSHFADGIARRNLE